MPDKVSDIPEELLKRIAAVTNKRARFVLDRIVQNGLVTTEEINQAGFDTAAILHRAACSAKS